MMQIVQKTRRFVVGDFSDKTTILDVNEEGDILNLG
jgi:hypothetical protein